MQEQGVPGVSIALIRDGEIIWSEGFGVANKFTKRPVTPTTTFKIASNSKVVTAYIALRLVDQGLLSLEEPLDNYLPEPTIPQAEYRDRVNLRRVLSHTSGMGHGSMSREIMFQPGAGYSYSANGFLFVQDVIEQITGESLEDLADEMVFRPLGMQNSCFASSSAVMSEPANGHHPAIVIIIVYVLPFVLAFFLVGVGTLIFWRVRFGTWRPTRRAFFVVYVISAVFGNLIGLLISFQTGMWDYAILIGLCGLYIAGGVLLAFVFGERVLKRFVSEQRLIRNVALVIWVIVSTLVLIGLLLMVQDLPVPGHAPVNPNAAGTVRATAEDMARFLIEITKPQYLSPETAAEMREPQVSLHDDLSWGLGPGIQHSPEGDALWQWGQAPDFQSVMIIYPESGYGVVVLTNSDWNNPDVAIDIAHYALGGRIDSIRRASHLEFNYRGPFLE
jgi:CubicO group peptidase (beta-lactamase class C family)